MTELNFMAPDGEKRPPIAEKMAELLTFYGYTLIESYGDSFAEGNGYALEEWENAQTGEVVSISISLEV